jgi:dihydromonapterin reductase/dihydrofolate reductase
MTQLEAKTVLITGVSRRLGLLACQYFLEQGHTVLAVTRKVNKDVQELANEYTGRFRYCECFSYDERGAQKVQKAFSNFSVDILINNASYFEPDSDSTAELARQFNAFYETHMLFPLLICEWFASQFSKAESEDNKGVIINMSDIYALKPDPQRAMYCATKAGLENLSLSLAAKYAPKVRVNTIQPGPMAFLPEHSQEEMNKVISQTPLAAEGGFEVLVDTMQFIINNHYVTGTSFKVDGGRSLVR